MIKKLIFYFIAVALFIVAVGIFSQKSSTLSLSQPPDVTEPKVNINGNEINLKVVKTQQDREKGLGGVASLDAGSGMLFVFENSDKPQIFWMKDMLIPIDIIWIKDGKVVKIDKNVQAPEPGTPENDLVRYSSGQKVDYVLEVNAGYSDANSIKEGDSVSFSGI